MYSRIIVPVDLAHVDKVERALTTAADLAAHYKVPVVYAAVTGGTPGPLAHTPAEFADKLAAFAAEQGASRGIETSSHAIVSHDPAVELDHALLKAVEETGADLVVMASHVPGLSEYMFPSHGGRMASHSKASVFVVREG